MLLRRRRRTAATNDDDVIVEHGPSLAKGPALVVGAILVAFGLTGLLTNADFPRAAANFPDGTAQGSSWLGFEVNGWTNFFAITAGALLMFGAAQHHLAKTMSLLVGLALAACAVIAIIDGQDVLGLAAANAWTKIGFAVAGGLMLVNALMPRTRRERRVGLAEDGVPAAAAPAAYDDTAATTVHRRGRFLRRPVRDTTPAVATEEEPVVSAGRQPPGSTDVRPPSS